MKCSHCGSDMLKEQVFCEKCGKERLLVPVFEPEIEDSVAASMSNIVQELSPDIQPNIHETAEESKATEKDVDADQHGTKQINFFVSAIVALIIFICVFSIFFYAYTENSFEYQYQRAQNAFASEKYEEALEIADICLTMEPDSIEIRLLILEIYQEQELTDVVIEKCKELIAFAPERQEPYDILIPIYIKAEEYQKLSQLLAKCQVSAVVESYADYMALPPEFDPGEGAFNTSISLKLIGGGNGTIYYTLDGSEPSKYSDRYTAPVKLLSGNYEVSAIYINDFGICSDIVTKTYDIESYIDIVPEISAPSGDYVIPQSIQVTVPDEGCSVYYTTDGSEPTMDSDIYTTAFLMPLGSSTFKFLMVDSEGNESEIVTRNYNCVPNVLLSTEQACFILKQQLILRGEILDGNGSMPGTTERKEYVCESAGTADGLVYYVIYEYLYNQSGTMIRTGNVYAISVMDGQIKRAAITENGYLSLSDF